MNNLLSKTTLEITLSHDFFFQAAALLFITMFIVLSVGVLCDIFNPYPVIAIITGTLIGIAVFHNVKNDSKKVYILIEELPVSGNLLLEFKCLLIIGAVLVFLTGVFMGACVQKWRKETPSKTTVQVGQ